MIECNVKFRIWRKVKIAEGIFSWQYLFKYWSNPFKNPFLRWVWGARTPCPSLSPAAPSPGSRPSCPASSSSPACPPPGWGPPPLRYPSPWWLGVSPRISDGNPQTGGANPQSCGELRKLAGEFRKLSVKFRNLAGKSATIWSFRRCVPVVLSRGGVGDIVYQRGSASNWGLGGSSSSRNTAYSAGQLDVSLVGVDWGV